MITEVTRGGACQIPLCYRNEGKAIKREGAIRGQCILGYNHLTRLGEAELTG